MQIHGATAWWQQRYTPPNQYLTYCAFFCSLHGRLVLTANVIAEGARKVCDALPATQAPLSYDIYCSELS